MLDSDGAMSIASPLDPYHIRIRYIISNCKFDTFADLTSSKSEKTTESQFKSHLIVSFIRLHFFFGTYVSFNLLNALLSNYQTVETCKHLDDKNVCDVSSS